MAGLGGANVAPSRIVVANDHRGTKLKRELRDYVQDVLSPARLRAQGWFKPAAVRQIVDQHMRGERDNNRAIWALLCLVLWYEN